MNGRNGLALACTAAFALLGCAGDSGNPRDVGGTGIAGHGVAGNGTGTAATGPNVFGNPGATPPPISTTPNGLTPSDVCETAHVTADPQIPEMMIVLDRSGSMQEGMRWMPSVSALRVVTEKLQSEISFGMALFPDPDAGMGGGLGCLTNPASCSTGCEPGHVVVEPMVGNAMAIGTALSGTSPQGGTPTPETLQALVGTYAAPPADPDVVPPPKFVLLVTDGQPTCPNGMGQDVTQPDIDASNAAIEALAAMGVRTYVIGYDTNTPGNEMLKTVLDGFAQRGGTGDTEHHPVEDEASLLATLESITAKIASCTFQLDTAPPRADYVRVRLDGQQVNLGQADGWELVGDRTVELKGASCMSLMIPAAHVIDVEVECEVVPPS